MDSDKATLFYIHAGQPLAIIEQVVDRIEGSDVGILHRYDDVAHHRIVILRLLYTKSE